eukprot:PLAT14706.1.p2 GENE.PLAT14706.1~~PLAT14706.1.p2  ORF type:complete len:285 (+),score=155.12 PLAT14706.1:176-1030(+)
MLASWLLPMALLQSAAVRTEVFVVQLALCCACLLYPLAWLALRTEPLAWLLTLVSTPAVHGMLCSYWLALLGITLLLRPDGMLPGVRRILLRKYFHALAVLMFLPGTLLAPQLMAVAYAGAFAVVAAVEVVRLAQLRGNRALCAWLAPYVDERDGGAVILTHLYLLLGCALPMWLTGSAAHDLLALAGVSVLGVGDACASLFGIALRGPRWPGTRKTVSGTIAAVLSMLLFAAALLPYTASLSATQLMAAVLATVAVCLLEAFTKQMDNLMLPVYYTAMLGCVL